jgi:hypothetical protein
MDRTNRKALRVATIAANPHHYDAVAHHLIDARTLINPVASVA